MTIKLLSSSYSIKETLLFACALVLRTGRRLLIIESVGFGKNSTNLLCILGAKVYIIKLFLGIIGRTGYISPKIISTSMAQ